MRNVKYSVTNFLYFQDQWLFVHRNSDRKVDPDCLNGIGGKLEPGENYLQAAIRETTEETGYQVEAADCDLAGVVSLHGGYEDDWVMCFFRVQVASMKIPIGSSNPEGKLLWLPADEVLSPAHTLVDDLHYSWQLISSHQPTFFMSAVVDENLKISDYTLDTLIK